MSEQPLYRVYQDSRLAVGRGVGAMWKQRIDAAVKTYDMVYGAWDEAYKYYNNSQSGSSVVTPRGVFKRGDSIENVVYSNTNVLIPAIYSKDPDIAVSTDDPQDEAFCKAMQKVLNVLFRRRDKLCAKSKIKKMVGFAALTNMGVLKLDFVLKDDSREYAVEQLAELSQQLEKADSAKDVEEVMGRVQALEQQMDLREPMGPKLFNVLPHNLIIDPYAEMDDALDANWMAERVYLQTEALKARFTMRDGDRDVLVFHPTHEVMMGPSQDGRDDGLSVVLRSLGEDREVPQAHSDEDRLAYIDKYYTECFYVQDKVTRRTFLFLRDDWKWPVWVWDDPLHLTRFFQYFITGFAFSTGGTTSVGEVSYYLDQQDEINDINRKVREIRRAIFDFWFFNSDATDEDEVAKFVEVIQGRRKRGKKILGVRAGEKKIEDIIMPFVPKLQNAEAFFNKQPSLDAINRVSSTNEGLRGVQFKANTNEASVNTYQDAMRLAVGAKVDAVEDCVGAVAESLAELCVQFYNTEDVANLVGVSYAQAWRQMSVEEFRSTININIVAGSLEKPTSVFKKKEAVEIAQAVGQFAKAAPGAALRIILKVLEQAFTEVVIKDEDWAAMDKEIEANLQRGNNAPGGGGQDQMQAAQQLPDQVKQQVVQMKQQGVPDEQIKQFVLGQIQGQQQ